MISPDNLESISEILNTIEKNDLNNKKIQEIRSQTVYNIGDSAIIGANYIMKLLNDLSSN